MPEVDMSDKEVEASLSLLHMMQRPAVATTSAKRKDNPAYSRSNKMAKTDQNGGLHDALLLAVASTQESESSASRSVRGDESEDEELERSSPNSNGSVRRHMQLTALSKELTLDELRMHFGKPIVDVAREFGICTTFLKKICRRCGIKRWPHRQIRSLVRTIDMLRQAERNATSNQEKIKFANQIAQLEAKKRAVIENPDAHGKLKRVKPCATTKNSEASIAEDEDMEVILDTGTASSQPSAPLLDEIKETSLSVEDLEPIQAIVSLASINPLKQNNSLPLSSSVDEHSQRSSDGFKPSESPACIPNETSVERSCNATESPASSHADLGISPSNRKLMVIAKSEKADVRFASASMGTLQDDNEERLSALATPVQQAIQL